MADRKFLKRIDLTKSISAIGGNDFIFAMNDLGRAFLSAIFDKWRVETLH